MTSTPRNMTTTSSTRKTSKTSKNKQMKAKRTKSRKPRKISFRELYIEHRDIGKGKPTPLQIFIEEVARITESSINTVRAWFSGTQIPERIKQSRIAEHFGVDIESLFPNVKNADNDENF